MNFNICLGKKNFTNVEQNLRDMTLMEENEKLKKQPYYHQVSFFKNS